MTDDRVLDKVRKLLRLAGNNPSEEEAASAAAAAQALLDAHNLTRAMVELESPAAREPEEPIQDFGRGAALDGALSRDRARWTLAGVIARANGCRIYFQSGHVCMVGRPSDVDAVRYLFAWTAHEMDRLAHQRKGFGRVWRNNFKLGIVDTISRKLRESSAATAEHAREEFAHNPAALMRVNQALARVEEREQSVAAWMKSNMKLRTTSSRGGRYDSGAREAGRRAGESIHLGGGARLASGAARLGA